MGRSARVIVEQLEQRAHFTVTTGTVAEAALDPNYVGGDQGVNLGTNDSFGTSALWTDARKTFAVWQYAGSNGTSLAGADVSKSGYPTGTSATNAAYTNSEMLGYPDGVYTMSYQGAGTVGVSGNGSILSGSTTTSTVNGVTTTTSLVALEKDNGGNLYLTANNFTTAGPLSNFHLMMPGFSPSTTLTLNPAVAARLQPFSTIRVMDLLRANNSKVSNWSDRTLSTDFTATGAYGVSYEDVIAFANQTQTNLWLNVPIDATDDFVTKLADLIKYGSDASGNVYTTTQANRVNSPLNINLKVTVELGNEIFNPGTASYTDNHTAAVANVSAGILEGSQSDINGEQSLLRIRQVRDDFANVYSPGVTNYSDSTQLTNLNSRISFTWAAQFDTTSGTEQPFTTGAINFSKFNNGRTDDNNPSKWGALSTWLSSIATSDYHGLLSSDNPTTATDLFNELNADIAFYGPAAITKEVAYARNNAGLPLVAYEGGVAITPTNSSQLALYAAASTDPRMDSFNQAILDEWYKYGGGQFNYYAYATDYNYFGTYGLLQYQDQAGTNKFDAVIKRLVPTADATLDGSVDFADFLDLKANWLRTGAYWQQGDFNGDGVVNLSDLQTLQSKINTSSFTAPQLSEYNAFIQYATNGTASTQVGTGLHGAYFSDLNQTTQVLSRTDPVIDFSWPQGGTGPDPTVGQAYFSTRWTGQIEAQTSEAYQFHTYSDDGIKVYVTVGGIKTLVINDYTDSSHEDVGSISLQAGQKYDIEVDYYQKYGNASVKLEWQTPSIPLEDVPTTMMFPSAVTGSPTGVTATGTAGGITLSIPAVAGASGYNIYRSLTPGGEGATAYLTNVTGNGTTVTVTDSSVTPGRTYYYTVTAINQTGESVMSAEVSAVATVATGAPASAPVAGITSGTGMLSLTWSTINGATSYSIYRATAANGEGTTPLVSGITATSYSDGNVVPGTKYYYTVVAVNSSGTSAFSNEVSGTAAVPAQPTLTDSDIGSPGQMGSASYDSTSGTYTIKGGGADIYGVGDQFNFDYTTLSGDQTLVARVATETATDYSTKAGLMFRQSRDSADAYADILVTPGQGVVFEYRDTNGSYTSTSVAGIKTPAWVKLVRSGNLFTGSYSLDGINWSVVGSRTINMNSTALAGMAVCAHNNNLLATATFTNVSLGSGPMITTAPAATVNAAGTTAALSVAASEGSATLTYTWSTATLPSGVTSANTPTFSATNGSAGGTNVTATFSRAGTYGLQVTIADPGGNTLVVPLSVTVNQLLTTLTVSPTSPVSVNPSSTTTFTASGFDQFAVVLATQPAIIWSLDAGSAGSINSTSGVYTAPATVGATATVRATSGSITSTASVTTTATSAKLSGTVFGTSGSYDGSSADAVGAVFDGSTSTFFDAPSSAASGAIAGLDFGSAYTVTSLKFAPRVGFESRMIGGVFQGSNSSSFANATTLYTVSSSPPDGLNTVSISGSYRYVRYVAPANSYGNIAEMQVFGYSAGADTTPPSTPGTPTLVGATSTAAGITWTASTDNVSVDHYVIYRNSVMVGTSTTNTYSDSGLTAGTSYMYTVTAVDPTGNVSPASGALTVITPSKLNGTAFGTSGSYSGSNTDSIGAVFDGSLNTFFDAPSANNAVVGLNLGSVRSLSTIAFAPRSGFSSRMVGGYFQVSNTADFSSATTVYTVTSAPTEGVLTTVSVGGSYQYIRYVAPSGSYGNIAEIQVYGSNVADSTPPTTPGTPTLTNSTSTTATIGWTASSDNIGVDHYVIYRGGVVVGTSTANSFADSGLTGGSTYSYTVVATDAAGNLSPASGALTFTTPTGVSAPAKLSGTVFGTSGSYDGSSADAVGAVFDGSTSTFFDAPSSAASGAIAGLDFGSAYTVTSLKFAPRVGFESRMIGGVFQGSNSSSFANATTLYTVSGSPPDGLNTVSISGSYRYVRYVAPANSYGNIAEMQVFGYSAGADTTPPSTPGTPTLVGATSTAAGITWTASTDNVSVDHYVIYRNSVMVGTSTTNTYSDSGLTAGTSYMYTVTAVDPTGNVSPASGALTVITPSKLSGTAFGTSGSYSGSNTDSIGAVFDGSLNTFFDAPSANNAVVGLNLGSVRSLSTIAFAPRSGFSSRMVGGYFQVSNTADFSSATTVYTVTSAPTEGVLTTVSVGGSYQYIRYVAPSGSYGNIAEIQVYGT